MDEHKTLDQHDDILSPSDRQGEDAPVDELPVVRHDEDSVPAVGTNTSENNGSQSAKYTVNVRKYANYDKDTESTYTDEEKQNLNYVSRTPALRFVLDFFFVLFRPGRFWKGQESHPATLLHLHFPHLVCLVMIRSAAILLGGIMMSGGMNTVLLVQALVHGLMIFVLVWVFALIVAGMSVAGGGGFHYGRALRYVGYGITPILFVGLVGLIPLPYVSTVCDLLAMPWAFVVFGAGVLPYLNVKPTRAPILTGLFCGILLCLWGILPMLIPYLIGLLG